MYHTERSTIDSRWLLVVVAACVAVAGFLMALLPAAPAGGQPQITANNDRPPLVDLGRPFTLDLLANDELAGETVSSITLVSGRLPLGLMLDNAGVVSGTPTEPGVTVFAYEVVTTSGQRDRATVKIPVLDNTRFFAILDRLGGVVGSPLSFDLLANDRPTDVVTSVVLDPRAGTPPPGLSVSDDGRLEGTPTEAGQYRFFYEVTLANGLTNDAPVNVTVGASDRPTIARQDTIVLTVGLPASLNIAENDDPGSPDYEVDTSDDLPAGMTLGRDGTFSGTPTTVDPVGSFSYRLTAGNGTSASSTVAYGVVPGNRTLAVADNLAATIGAPISANVTDNDHPTDEADIQTLISFGELPRGVVFDQDGTLRGVPTQDGLFQLNYVLQSGGDSDFTTMTIVVSGDETTNGVITGTMAEEDGRPASGFQVIFHHRNDDGTRGDEVIRKRSDGDGGYRFFGVPGCYDVVYRAEPGFDFVETGGDLIEEPICIQAGQTVVRDVAVMLEVPKQPTVGAVVVDVDGQPVDGVSVELFTTTPDGERGEFRGQVFTSAEGTAGFDVKAGCHHLTIVAPEGTVLVGGNTDGRFINRRVCSPPRPEDDMVTVVLNPVGAERIGGTVTQDGSDSPVPMVEVDLFRATADGNRGLFIGATETAEDGTFEFGATPGCFIVTFIAPEATQLVDGNTGGRYLERPVCVTAGEQTPDVDAEVRLTGQ